MSRLLDCDRFHTDKLAWQHQVMTDPRLGAFAKLLGAFVMHYLDEKREEAGPHSRSWPNAWAWTSEQFDARRTSW